MSRSYKIRGVVAKRIKIGEADAFILVISQQSGLTRFKARGVQKIKSKLSGYLQSPNFVELEIARGRGSQDIICNAETIRSYPKIKTDLLKIAFTFFIIENYIKLVGEAQEKKAFQLLVDTLDFLNKLKKLDGISRLLYIWVIINLLNYSGQSLELYRCSGCKSKLSDKILFSPESGGTICKSCAKNVTIAFDVPQNGIKLLRILSRINLSSLKKLKVKESDLEKTYLAISLYNEYFIDYRLNSKGFFDDIRKRV